MAYDRGVQGQSPMRTDQGNKASIDLHFEMWILLRGPVLDRASRWSDHISSPLPSVKLKAGLNPIGRISYFLPTYLTLRYIVVVLRRKSGPSNRPRTGRKSHECFLPMIPLVYNSLAQNKHGER